MKKSIILLLALTLCLGATKAQTRKFSTYYYQRATLFEKMTTKNNGVIFIGDSITDGGEWCTLFNNSSILNFGISGDGTEGVLARIDVAARLTPKKIFIMIGINDLAKGMSPDTIAKNIEKITDALKVRSPRTKVYLQSVLPVNASFKMFDGHVSKGKEIIALNALIKTICEEKGYTFIDLYSSFKQSDSELMNPKYTNDGLHLLGDGYLLWSSLIKHHLK
ncbi:GDSL-type esterase/lipase family protein [Acetobacteroides hydrogenigenes]|uniref:Lysophospholipase L1-like esterase n=1 Tax=Acetobacteroides hydrogenigenes TaxID=979970 RepID=A0A4R2EAC4_9BACT|nr:GDSL-type esterase/lipase family protein [Acetobacteroides hydrogenigenes]TCN65668.1 lysophospholipase L1-like esterase [Acetobacteroides hydrogenigenes]